MLPQLLNSSAISNGKLVDTWAKLKVYDLIDVILLEGAIRNLQLRDIGPIGYTWPMTKTNKHKSTTQHRKLNKMNIMGLTKGQVLSKRKQFMGGEDSQSSIHRSTLRMSPIGAKMQLMAAICLEADTCMHLEFGFHAQFLYLYRHLIRWNIKLSNVILLDCGYEFDTRSNYMWTTNSKT